AGAFALAWIAVNWQPVLLIFFSKLPVESRIAIVAKHHLGLVSTLWKPLAIAALIAIGFYVFSALFVVLAEFYGLAQSTIQRLFDKIRWVSPTNYIEFKQTKNAKIAELQTLASDNVELLDKEKAQNLRLSGEVQAVKNRLASTLEEVALKDSALADQQVLEAASASVHAETLIQLQQALASRLAVREEVAVIDGELESLRGALRRTTLPTEPVEWNRFLILAGRVKKLRSTMESIDSVSDWTSVRTSEENIVAFLSQKFDNLPINRALLSKIVAELKDTTLGSRLVTMGEIEKMMKSAEHAVAAYRMKNPKVFASSVDYLSKSLGFVYPEFREIHKFGKETIHAFEQFESLLLR
ncbi:MAG: hypothetical protein OJI67_22600, partial [Prosthecobacter sp.]|nr:hypothetical protein [Prosthecobacter sp.]